MNRRIFARRAALFVSVSLLPTIGQTGFANQATPESTDDDRYIRDFATLDDVVGGVTRYAYAASPGFDFLMSGDLYYVDAWGFDFSSVASTQAAPLEMAYAYKQWMTLERGIEVGSLQNASARRLGDEAWGWVAPITEDDDDTEYQWSLYSVRKDTTLQILVGATASGSPLRRLADISEAYIDRWPNSLSPGLQNGVEYGGLWDVLPQLPDLEEGMVIDYSYDVIDHFQATPEATPATTAPP